MMWMLFGMGCKDKALECEEPAKKSDTPDLGQTYFIDSYRHQWEADLWKLLGHMRRYRDMLADNAPAHQEEPAE